MRKMSVFEVDRDCLVTPSYPWPSSVWTSDGPSNQAEGSRLGLPP